MKNLIQLNVFLLFFALFSFSLHASPFTISGQVVLAPENEPVPGMDILILSEDGEFIDLAISGEDGTYSVTIDLEDGVVATFTVQSFDWCTGDILLETVSNENSDEAEANFVICGDFEFPDCYASFYSTEPAGLEISFFDDSYPADEITSWHWDFGDGTTSTEQHPTHTFPEDGEYIVTLTITTDTCENSLSQHIWVGDGWGWEECFIWFHYYWPTDNLLELTFQAEAEGEILEIEWDFGDGNSSNELMPTHTYQEEGIYEVFVEATIVTEGDTCTTSWWEHICIGEGGGWEECWAAFEYEYLTDDGHTVQFTDYSEGAVAWFWDFGDGNFSEEQNPVHTYEEDGFYFVFLTITTEDGCVGFSENFVIVGEGGGEDCPCTTEYEPVCVILDNGVVISFPNSCIAECEGYSDYVECDGGGGEECWVTFDYSFESDNPLTVTFYGAASVDQAEWFWDFGDGNTSTEPNPTHTYEEAGAYPVFVMITTPDGCTSEFFYDVWVGEDGPWTPTGCQAMFWFDMAEDDPMTLSFEDMSFGDNINEWHWNFGDGNSSNEQNPTHTYTEGGTYVVTLTVSDGECSSTFGMLVWTDDNIWYSDSCQALFMPFLLNNEILLLDLSQGHVVEWSWDLGDGTTSDQPFVHHSYEEAGTYTISLSIVTADGCTSTFEITIDMEGGNLTGDATTSALILNNNKKVLAELSEVQLVPNPVQDIFTLDFKGQDNQYQIDILDAQGQLVKREQFQNYAGQQSRYQQNISDLSSGMYFVVVRSDHHLQTLKLVKE